MRTGFRASSGLTLFLSCLLFLTAGCQRKPAEVTEAGFAARAVPKLTPARRLRKLSLHLRGRLPESAEYAALAAAGLAGEGAFFAGKAREYLASPQHVGKMIDRLDELFRVKTAEGLPETRLVVPNGEDKANFVAGRETVNALDLLFQDIARHNLRWDALLVTRELTIPVPHITAGINDHEFFRALVPNVPPSPNPFTAVDKQGYFPAKFAASDPRIAGAVTTGRFFTRYSTTNLNRSRGRAAAVFRIFLCDDMRAVVEPKPGEDEELLKKAFPPEPPKPDRSPFVHRPAAEGAFTDDDPHGKEPACMACHYKLDPMGRTFFALGTVLSEEPSPGALVYKRADGSLVQVPARGLGDIAASLVREPEYARCQALHFWRWFVRGDEAPTEARLAALVSAFESHGRRTNDFIAWLTEQPEFLAAGLDPAEVSFLKLKPILSRCTSCHAGLEQGIPSFEQLPLQSPAQHVTWLERIVTRLDLKHDGAKRTMPPKTSAWQPTADDLTLVKAWIARGAADEGGQATIDAATAASLLDPASPMPTMRARHGAAFKDSYVRYLSGHDLFRVLVQKFPDSEAAKSVPPECKTFTDKNRALLGDTNPANGELTYRGPSAAYVKWYTKCAIRSIHGDLESALAKAAMAPYFGAEALALLATEPYAGVVQSPRDVPWARLSLPIRSAVARDTIRRLIGPGIVEDEAGFAATLVDVLQRREPRATAFDALAKLSFYVTTQDEFLVY